MDPALRPAAADDFPRDLPRFIVQQHHVVAVPADRPGHMQRDLREEGQQRRDLVRYHFRRVIMAVVHQRDAFVPVHCRVGQGEFRASRGIGLHADPEDLALNAGFHLAEVVGFRQDFIHGLPVADPGSQAVPRDILETVAGPDVHHAGFPQLLRQGTADPDARLPVFNPEFPGLRVRRGQRQRIAFRMGKERRVEIASQAAFPAEFDPLPEVLRLQFVPVRPFAVFKNRVAGMQVHLRRARNQAEHLVQVVHQFLRGPGPARIVPRGLDPARQRFGRIRVKAAHVVPLPAVQGNRDILQDPDGRLRVHSRFRVPFPCFCKAHKSASICIFRFPRIVASMGSAMTSLPVASSVSRFRNRFFAPPPAMQIFR